MDLARLTAIVPAAGSGIRLGAGTSKPFVKLADKPLVLWTLTALELVEEIAEIIPVFSEADHKQGLKIIDESGLKKIKRVAVGGRERQDSVYNALKLVEDSGVILIHDGARPLIEPELIKTAIASLRGFDGVVVAVPVKDTVKESDDRGVILKTPDRRSLWAAQTPQIFPLKTILSAYEDAILKGVKATDDASLVERRGGRVKLVMGSYMNIKVTTPDDIELAERFLYQRIGR